MSGFGISEAEARAQTWTENPELGKVYNVLSVEPEQTQSEPVQKGADVLREHGRKTAKLRKSRPELSSAQARAGVCKQNSDRIRRYREAFASYRPLVVSVRVVLLALRSV